MTHPPPHKRGGQRKQHKFRQGNKKPQSRSQISILFIQAVKLPITGVNGQTQSTNSFEIQTNTLHDALYHADSRIKNTDILNYGHEQNLYNSCIMHKEIMCQSNTNTGRKPLQTAKLTMAHLYDSEMLQKQMERT